MAPTLEIYPNNLCYSGFTSTSPLFSSLHNTLESASKPRHGEAELKHSQGMDVATGTAAIVEDMAKRASCLSSTGDFVQFK